MTMKSSIISTKRWLISFQPLVQVGSCIILILIASSELTTADQALPSSSSLFVRRRGNNDGAVDTRLNNSNNIERKLTTSMERCLEDEIFSERTEIGVECICKEKENEGIVLVCSDECAFCNNQQSICGIKSTEALYDVDTGSRIGIGLVFEYIKIEPSMLDNLSSELTGTAHVRNNNDETPTVVLGIEEIDCIEDEDTHKLLSCKSCNVYLGGSKCTSCELLDCDGDDGDIVAPIMDCSNIQEGAKFNFCEKVEMQDSSLFQAFLPGQFDQCLPMEVLVDGMTTLGEEEDATGKNGFSTIVRTNTIDALGNKVKDGRVVE